MVKFNREKSQKIMSLAVTVVVLVTLLSDGYTNTLSLIMRKSMWDLNFEKF